MGLLQDLRDHWSEYLFVSDLDGTLLDGSMTMPSFTSVAISRLLDRGLKFTIASARSPHSAFRILEPLPLTLPIILHNGVIIADPRSKKMLSMLSLTATVADQLLAIGNSHGLSPYLLTFGDAARLYFLEPENEGQRFFIDTRTRRNDPRLRKTSRLRDHLDEQVIQVCFVGTEEGLAGISAEIGATLRREVTAHFFPDVYCPPFYWLDVVHPEATKDRAVATVAKMCDLPLCRVVSFGDSLNDIEMFKVSAVAIAVKNAHDRVKEAAHLILDRTADEDAVAHFLTELTGERGR
jgi:hypothetical protein